MVKFKLWVVITVTILIIITVGVVSLIENNTQNPKDYDSFAKCLNESGAKLYGAFWCPHCKDQKEMFGESIKYVPYVECSGEGNLQTDECNEAGIEYYPTWIFKDGTKKIAVLNFKELSESSGCKL